MKAQLLKTLRLLAVLLAASATACDPSTSQQLTVRPDAREAGTKQVDIQQDREPADLLIFGGTVVTMNTQRQVFENGAVAIVDGAIAARFLNEVIEYLESPSRTLLAP